MEVLVVDKADLTRMQLRTVPMPQGHVNWKRLMGLWEAIQSWNVIEMANRCQLMKCSHVLCEDCCNRLERSRGYMRCERVKCPVCRVESEIY